MSRVFLASYADALWACHAVLRDELKERLRKRARVFLCKQLNSFSLTVTSFKRSTESLKVHKTISASLEESLNNDEGWLIRGPERKANL